MANAIEPTQLLQEHAAEACFRTLGKRHGVSHEPARKLARAAVDDLAIDVIVRAYSACGT